MDVSCVAAAPRCLPGSRTVADRPGRGRQLWAILLAALALGLAFQGSRPLWEPDEGRYAAVALDMVRHGDWLLPHLHPEQLHPSKPPLTYWTMAGSMQLLGETEWAVRLPNALAFALTAWLVAWIGATLRPRGALAGALYATLLLPFVAADLATTDTLVTLWETLAVAGFVDARWGGAARRGPLLLWLGLGLAFLTKGPPALLPLLAIAVFVLAADGRAGLRRLAPAWGLALFLVVGLGWYAWAAWSVPGLLRYWLGSEVAARVLSGSHDRNADAWGAVRVYLPVLLAGTLPWGALALRPIARALRSLGSRGRAAFAERGAALFLVLWLLLPLAVFALARSRMPLYLLPLMAPVALLAAPAVGARRPARSTAALAALWVVALLALKARAAGYGGERDAALEAAGLPLAESTAEIVFVDARPRYGLAFYRDVDVEAVWLSAPSLYPFEHTLAEELAEPGHDRLFVLPPDELAAFRAAAREAGWRIDETSGWESEGVPYRVLRVRQRRGRRGVHGV